MPEVSSCIILVTTMVSLTLETSVRTEMHIVIPNSPQPYGKYKTQTRTVNSGPEVGPPERALDSYMVLTTPEWPFPWFQLFSS